MDAKNVVLTGFMGTGKTSVGKILSRRLERPLIDLDAAIERKEQKKIREIFESRGEPYFRALEKDAVREAAETSGSVITTGGGVVLDAENMLLLRKRGLIVQLNATPETVFRRVKDSPHRPLLKSGDLLSEITRLFEARAPFYTGADATFDTDGKTASQVAEEILAVLKGKI